MSTLTGTITGYVVGDDLEIRRTVTELPDAIEYAWLTVKRHARVSDDDAVLKKAITETNVAGTGHIEVDGGVGSPGTLRFDLTPADTTALGDAEWVYDIQIKLDNGSVYTPEVGTLELTPDVRRATS
jgi:hypothetical protein